LKINFAAPSLSLRQQQRSEIMNNSQLPVKYFSNLISQTTEPPAPQHPGQSPRNVEEGRIIDLSSDKARGKTKNLSLPNQCSRI
ncbi:hypothetical protein, partial [Azonexus sp.]|uniref:hypothetical protein n=1 Tax=Azonexus sp. TaxID=1872668 RepID=UPI0035AEBB55